MLLKWAYYSLLVISISYNFIPVPLLGVVTAADDANEPIDFDWNAVGSDACSCYWKSSEKKSKKHLCKCTLEEPSVSISAATISEILKVRL